MAASAPLPIVSLPSPPRAPRAAPPARAAKIERRRPSDWRWQLRHAVTTVEALDRALVLTAEEREGAMRAVSSGFPFSITPHYLALCDRRDATCPVRRQCVPRAEES